jgi:4-hydroxybenzoate polyprenyltransferase
VPAVCDADAHKRKSEAPASGYSNRMTSVDLPASANRVSLAAAVFDLSRGRQALLSVAQPALGALVALGHFPEPWRIGLGLVAATAGYLAVFSLNDVLDRRVDAAALEHSQTEAGAFDLDAAFVRHPIAHGDLSLVASVTWIASLGVLSAVCAYVLAPVCLALFGVAVALEVLYCRLASVTWTKTFVSGAMVAVGGLAGWAAVAPITIAAWSLAAFLALWEMAGRNLPNDLSDLTADARVGVRTVATAFGASVSATWTLIGAAATVVVIALIPAPPVFRVVWVAMAVAMMLAPAVSLVRRPVPAQAGAYFNRASTVPALMFAASLLLLALGV